MAGRGVPVTEAELMKIRTLHGKGWSAGKIAKELGRPRTTVTRCAAKMGMFFDHAQTDAATKAAAIDMAARRARIAARLLDESEELLDDIKRPYIDHVFTVKGEYVQHAAMPTPQDKAHLTRSASNLLAEHRRMAEFDYRQGRHERGRCRETVGGMSAAVRPRRNGDRAVQVSPLTGKQTVSVVEALRPG